MIIQAEFLRAVRSAFVPDFSPSHPLDELRQGQRLRGGQFEFNLYIFHGYTSQGHGKGRCSASARTQASSRRFCRPSADCARASACASIFAPIFTPPGGLGRVLLVRPGSRGSRRYRGQHRGKEIPPKWVEAAPFDLAGANPRRRQAASLLS